MLGDIINSRKENILKTLSEAENRFKEAEQSLKFAKENFENAKMKADQIRSQGTIVSVQATKAILNTIDEDIRRLKSSNLSLIKLEQEKSVNEICQQLSRFALLKAIEKIDKKINYNLQKKFITQNIELFSIKTIN